MSLCTPHFEAFQGDIETIETQNSDKLIVNFAEKERHMIAEKNGGFFFHYGNCISTIYILNEKKHCVRRTDNVWKSIRFLLSQLHVILNYIGN